MIPASLEEQPRILDLLRDEETLGRLRRVHNAFGEALREERLSREIDSLDHRVAAGSSESEHPCDRCLIYDRFDQRVLAERLVADFASHVYFPAELELLFVSAGFEIAQQYGDYRFAARDRTSQFVVTVARRPHHSARRPLRWPWRHNTSRYPVNDL